jgi:hypothetical protein
MSKIRASREKRFNREDESFVQAAMIPGIIPGRDHFGFFMQRAANTMAGKVADERITALEREPLDGLSNALERRTRPNGAYALCQRFLPIL